MDTDLTKMDTEFLKDILKSEFSNLILIDRKKEKTEDDTYEMGRLRDFCERLKGELDKRTKKTDDVKMDGSEDSNQSETKAIVKDFTSYRIKNMGHTLASEVPIFSSGCDVHNWLTKLESYYKLFVLSNQESKAVMEVHFVELAKSRLCSEYLNSMMASEVKTSTFEEMKDYMKKHHSSKQSIFQVLDTLWELEQTESESLRDFGIKLNDKALEAKNIVFAKFKEFCELKEETKDKEMTAEDIFKVVAGQVFLQSLKSKKQAIFNNVCNDLDKCWDAEEIANKAMTYQDRMVPDNDQNQGNPPAAFPANSETKNKKTSRDPPKEKKKKKGTCFRYLKGECKYGTKCYFEHDKNVKDAVLGLREISGGDNKDKKGEKKGNETSGRGTAYVATSAHTMPIVPFPPQDFHQ